ncbi:TolB family protein [Streptomyces sp. NPDC127108]|uniref:TolB family protein n=1 Tax=Streptomyces sp. NPDC127108 TaxID=3345361 RepID=UPI00363AE885
MSVPRRPGRGRAGTLAAAALALSTASLTTTGTAHAHADTTTHTAPGTATDAAHRAPRTERVSTGSDGAQLDGRSLEAGISADGRYVAFATKAERLGCHQQSYTCLVLKDRVTGELTRIPNDGDSSWGTAMLSRDGRRVGHTAGTKSPAPMLYDRETGRNVNVGAPGNGTGLLSAVSPDGGTVAYTSGDRFHPAKDLRVRDLATGADELIGGDGRFGAASLSADGRLLAYAARGADGADLFVRDRRTGATTQIDQGLGEAGFVQLAENGRTALFAAGGRTYAYDVRKGAAREVADRPVGSASPDARYAVLAEGADGTALTLLDVRSGVRTPVGPGAVVPGAVTAKGRAVAFTSAATDLVPDDTNGSTDIFLRHTR